MPVPTGVLGSHDLVDTLGRFVAIVGDDRSLVLRTHRVRHLQRQRRPLQHRIPAASVLRQCRPVRRHHGPVQLRSQDDAALRGVAAGRRLDRIYTTITPAYPASASLTIHCLQVL